MIARVVMMLLMMLVMMCAVARRRCHYARSSRCRRFVCPAPYYAASDWSAVSHGRSSWRQHWRRRWDFPARTSRARLMILQFGIVVIVVVVVIIR